MHGERGGREGARVGYEVTPCQRAAKVAGECEVSSIPRARESERGERGRERGRDREGDMRHQYHSILQITRLSCMIRHCCKVINYWKLF